MLEPMKINMWKLLIAGLFASAALAGCEDNRNNFMVDDTLSFVNEEQYAGVSVYNCLLYTSDAADE